MFEIKQAFILSLIFITVEATCHNTTSKDNFLYKSALRLLRNDSVEKGKIFCSQDTNKDPQFALFKGKIPYIDSIIGVYRNDQQSHYCYFRKISKRFVDVTDLTWGELYTIGN